MVHNFAPTWLFHNQWLSLYTSTHSFIATVPGHPLLSHELLVWPFLYLAPWVSNYILISLHLFGLYVNIKKDQLIGPLFTPLVVCSLMFTLSRKGCQVQLQDLPIPPLWNLCEVPGAALGQIVLLLMWSQVAIPSVIIELGWVFLRYFWFITIRTLWLFDWRPF